ncbi:hypothetical protein SAMN04488057_106160 [Cyclobacterium lianum]|uniref:Uncharacterized protein n=1 Tax=Cyclobacterium lianum TaxID=388280 RepID=A0A1M7NYR4_9BACT|nr:hypothetical protein [Cyclobacterium lianum]SHN08964.1 hypothetical protein SAMN04488057_106160 [Cyclobacterium lianum]
MNKTTKIVSLLLLALSIGLSPACTEEDEFIAEVFQVPARATFLKTDVSDTPVDPVIIGLEENGIATGTRLSIRTLGDFINSPSGSTRSDAVGLFSATLQLLGSEEQNRVPGAIDAGENRMTDNTFEGNLPTDIEEDFRIDEETIEIVVPTGAQYLFLGNADSKQSDNSETAQGFRVEIRFPADN